MSDKRVTPGEGTPNRPHEDLIRDAREQVASIDHADGTQCLRDAAAASRKAGETHPPEHVGPYKIMKVLGEGGMGTVYLAQQEKPVRRRVALKLIKAGMDTRQVVARFEAEQQALALMNHPGIAKVFDVGTTEQGRPYFTMEHVPGLRITDYCDKQRLTTKERLELFMQVCEAVQHAHQKAVIHRDIKPSNILVTIQDGKPVPKIIDFGVAKATEQRLTERTLFTEQGQLVGTPEYMSPEQAEMTALDIDTRTDIYSLGVVLYELLAGALPFEPTTLRHAGFAEIQRIIREEEPPKPSTKISSLGDESTSIAHRRHTDRSALARQLRGDLDWITLKAMEKDRTRRYASTTEFAADIQRHLHNEPVLASPPSLTYRFAKLVRRCPGLILGVTAVVAVVVLGLLLVTQRIQKSHDDILAFVREGTLRTEAKQWGKAEAAFRQAIELDPHSPQAVLEYTRMKVHRFFDGPDTGHSEKGVAVFLEQVHEEYQRGIKLAPDNPTGWNRLGIILKMMGRYVDAIKAYEKALSVRPSSYFAQVNIATAYALLRNLGRARTEFRRATEMAALATDEDDLPYAAQAWRNLASLQLYRGKLEAAQKNAREALRRNPDDPYIHLILARVLLAQDGTQHDSDAANRAWYADEASGGENPRAKRIFALAQLRNQKPEQAIAAANAALELNDLAEVNHLIKAIAQARLGRPEESRVSLEAASTARRENPWPDDGYSVSAPKGFLWFDSKADMDSLREEALAALARAPS